MAVRRLGRLRLNMIKRGRVAYGLVGGDAEVCRSGDRDRDRGFLQDREKRRRKNERGVHGWIAGW